MRSKRRQIAPYSRAHKKGPGVKGFDRNQVGHAKAIQGEAKID